MSKLTELETALADATAQLRAAEERGQLAARETTAWINKVNEAQRNFDAYLKEIRDAAPRSSNWKQRERIGAPV